MTLLLVKLLVAPAIVVATSLAGRRFGSGVSGWLVGLPLMSGPITCFFAVEHGRRFAARSGVGSLSGTIGEAAFCVGWAVAARRAGWRTSLATASAAFVAAALAVEALPLDERLPIPLLPLAGAALAALLVALRIVRTRGPAPAPTPPTRWDLPARAIVAAGVLLLLTAVATTLGARLSGLVAVYPMYSAVLAGFGHRHDGAAAAVGVLRGLLLGLFAFAAFYLALSALLPRTSIAVAFAAATTICLAVQAATLLPLRRERRRAAAARELVASAGA